MISFKSIKAGFEIQEPAFFRSWLKNVLSNEGSFKMGDIQYVFCEDGYLLEINKKFLGHQSLTDIITFPTTELKNIVSGDIFISVDRVIENSRIFKKPIHEELSRVIVHGLLHLVGYRDGNDEEKTIMRQKEEYYLNLQPQKIPDCFT